MMRSRRGAAARGPARHRDQHEGERAKLAVTLIAAVVIGITASTATWSAWTAQTGNAGNTFTAGTVTISDNDSGSTLFTLPAMRPGTPVSRCIRVNYTGTLPSEIRLFGATTAGTGLAAYIDLTVTRGTVSAGAFGDCTNFTPDVTNHLGMGAGVLFDDVMSAYPSTWAAGIVDPTAAWATNDTHYYRFTVDVANDDNAQGKTATETFTWEAR
jgi:hypothetical protein